MKSLSWYHWLFAIAATLACHAALALGWPENDTPLIERSSGPPVTIVGSLTNFSNQEATEETVKDVVEPVEEVAHTEPTEESPVEPVQNQETQPVEEAAIPATPPKTEPKKKQKTKKAKPKKKPKKKQAKKDKKKQKKRLGGKRTAALRKGGGALGKQKRIAGNAAISNYRGRIQSHLSRYKRSPGAGLRGRTVVHFTISRSGRLIGVRLSRSSGSPALDRATLSMVRRASPFPAIPSGGPGRMAFSIPVSYR